MPKGKYVNHKGRSRHFTSPEELQEQELEKDSGEESSEEEEWGAGSSSAKEKKKADKKLTSGSEESEESEEEFDRDCKKGVASLIEIENPNRAVKKATKKVSEIKLDGVTEEVKPQLSRREREVIEKQKERQRFEKLHAAGKTDEARADLARLAIIRQQRAEAAAKREAEKKALEEKKAPSNKA